GAARVYPPQRTEDRIGEQQVQRRGRGICRCCSDRITVSAHSRPALQLILSRSRRSANGSSSRTPGPRWFPGHSISVVRRMSDDVVDSEENKGHDYRYGDGAQAPETAREEHEHLHSLPSGHRRQGLPDIGTHGSRAALLRRTDSVLDYVLDHDAVVNLG